MLTIIPSQLFNHLYLSPFVPYFLLWPPWPLSNIGHYEFIPWEQNLEVRVKQAKYLQSFVLCQWKELDDCFSRLSRVDDSSSNDDSLKESVSNLPRCGLFYFQKAERRFKISIQLHTSRRRRCAQKETTNFARARRLRIELWLYLWGRWPTINNQPLVVQMNNQAPTESSLRLPGGNESICSFSIRMVDDHRWYHNQSTLLECSVECQATMYSQRLDSSTSRNDASSNSTVVRGTTNKNIKTQQQSRLIVSPFSLRARAAPLLLVVKILKKPEAQSSLNQLCRRLIVSSL